MAKMTLDQAVAELRPAANGPHPWVYGPAVNTVLEGLKILMATPFTADVTSIPDLIKAHGSMAAACRATGLSEHTIQKYRDDVMCDQHVIYRGRLMSHKRHSPRIYSRRGVTRTDRLKKEMW